MTRESYRVVQPWGPNVASQSTEVGRHDTADAAFAYIDELADRWQAQGLPSDTLELKVIDERGLLVVRPNAQ